MAPSTYTTTPDLCIDREFPVEVHTAYLKNSVGPYLYLSLIHI